MRYHCDCVLCRVTTSCTLVSLPPSPLTELRLVTLSLHTIPELRNRSQPLRALPSQSIQPKSQVGVHALFEQPTPPCALVHGLLHPPQCCASFVVSSEPVSLHAM